MYMNKIMNISFYNIRIKLYFSISGPSTKRNEDKCTSIFIYTVYLYIYMYTVLYLYCRHYTNTTIIPILLQRGFKFTKN